MSEGQGVFAGCPGLVVSRVIRYCAAAAIWEACGETLAMECRRHTTMTDGAGGIPSLLKAADTVSCEEETWALMKPFCEPEGLTDQCKQVIAEECAQDAAGATAPATATETPAPAPSSGDGSILASLQAQVTFTDGQDAYVAFQATHFNLGIPGTPYVIQGTRN